MTKSEVYSGHDDEAKINGDVDEEEEKICFVILAACEGNVCTLLLQAAKMTNQKFCFVMQVTLFGLRL
jgi:hypothetical protein